MSLSFLPSPCSPRSLWVLPAAKTGSFAVAMSVPHRVLGLLCSRVLWLNLRQRFPLQARSSLCRYRPSARLNRMTHGLRQALHNTRPKVSRPSKPFLSTLTTLGGTLQVPVMLTPIPLWVPRLLMLTGPKLPSAAVPTLLLRSTLFLVLSLLSANRPTLCRKCLWAAELGYGPLCLTMTGSWTLRWPILVWHPRSVLHLLRTLWSWWCPGLFPLSVKVQFMPTTTLLARTLNPAGPVGLTYIPVLAGLLKLLMAGCYWCVGTCPNCRLPLARLTTVRHWLLSSLLRTSVH